MAVSIPQEPPQAKKHVYTCRNCNKTFSDEADYANHSLDCFKFDNYYNSPMRLSPVQFPPRFPPQSPARFPPKCPPRFPRGPLYLVTETLIHHWKKP